MLYFLNSALHCTMYVAASTKSGRGRAGQAENVQGGEVRGEKKGRFNG